MSVNYKAIADRAEAIIGSTDSTQYQLAYDTMISETVNKEKPGEVRMNRRLVMGELGVSTAASLLAKVSIGLDNSGLDAASISFLKAEIDGEGLDLKHPETQGMLAQFVSSGIMTQAEVDQLLGLKDETVSAWPGLLPGHVQNALEKRAGGLV